MYLFVFLPIRVLNTIDNTVSSFINVGVFSNDELSEEFLHKGASSLHNLDKVCKHLTMQSSCGCYQDRIFNDVNLLALKRGTVPFCCTIIR